MNRYETMARESFQSTLTDAASLFGDGIDWEGGETMSSHTGTTWCDPDYDAAIRPDGTRRSMPRPKGEFSARVDTAAAMEAFQALPDKVKKKCRTVLSRKFLEPVVQALRRNVPVDTGLMQSKLTRRFGQLRSNGSVLFGIVGVPEQVYFAKYVPKKERATLRSTETEKERRLRMRRSIITRPTAKRDKYAEVQKKAWSRNFGFWHFEGYTRGVGLVKGRFQKRYTLDSDGTFRAAVSEQLRRRQRKADVADQYYEKFYDVTGRARKTLAMQPGEQVRLIQRMPAIEIRFLEFGTKRIRAQAFVRRTFQEEQCQSLLERELSEQLNTTIAEVVRDAERKASKGRKT